MTDTGVAYWDAQAATVEEARRAVWAADGWDEGVADTLDILGRWLGDLPDRPRLVDVGCGMGRVAVPAVSRFKARVVGVDMLANQRPFARTEATQRGVKPRQ